jgi:hypothetical protein
MAIGSDPPEIEVKEAWGPKGQAFRTGRTRRHGAHSIIGSGVNNGLLPSGTPCKKFGPVPVADVALIDW